MIFNRIQEPCYPKLEHPLHLAFNDQSRNITFNYSSSNLLPGRLQVTPLFLIEKLVFPPGLLHSPLPHPNQPLYNKKDDKDACCNAQNIPSHNSSPANLVVVQEVVHIPVLILQGYERDSKISQQYQDQPKHVNPRHGLRPGEDNLENSHDRVDTMLGHVGVYFKLVIKLGVDDTPVDDGHQRWEAHNGGVIERVHHLQEAREAVKERPLGIEDVR